MCNFRPTCSSAKRIRVARCARPKTLRGAFTLLELIVVIATMAVIASIAIPRISKAFDGAGKSAVGQDWATLQRQIDLYALEHDGHYPGFGANPSKQALAHETFSAHLTAWSNRAGDTSVDPDPDFPYGPYVRGSIPTLKAGPHAGSNTVHFAAPGVAPAYMPEVDAGWIYQMQTGEIVPNVALRAANLSVAAGDVDKLDAGSLSVDGK